MKASSPQCDNSDIVQAYTRVKVLVVLRARTHKGPFWAKYQILERRVTQLWEL